MTYTPAPNAFGDAVVALVMKDNGGTANGGVDTSTQQTGFTVTPINDVPTFTKGLDQTVNEDGGSQFVSNWATNISPGPNESDGLSFQVTNNTNPGLFAQQPAVFSSGSLS